MDWLRGDSNKSIRSIAGLIALTIENRTKALVYMEVF
jgi:hypothetical protein